MRYRMILAVSAVSLLCWPHVAEAQGCASDLLGRVTCAPPGGGAESDFLGQVKTGPGQCVQDILGQVMCSKVRGGGAATDLLGRAVCYGGCVPGK
jgi:hypothetical protein